MNILLVSGHTYPQSSLGNKRIVELLKKDYPNLRESNLIELYPDFQIDIKKEQEKLLWADLIIIQSPLFWYSLTSLTMRWMEEVLQHGWAYGSKGHMLDHKKIILGITAGSSNKDYQTGGIQDITIEEIVKPYQVIFDYCRMDRLGYVFTGGIFNTGSVTEENSKKIEELAADHVKKIERLLKK